MFKLSITLNDQLIQNSLEFGYFNFFLFKN
jgi:hypothetical protein